MEKTLVVITAQYYENYGYSDGSDFWKPKGGQEFHIYADSDDFFYGEQFCIQAIKEMLAEESNAFARYEYLSHELIFSDPIKLDSEKFAKKLGGIYEQQK